MVAAHVRLFARFPQSKSEPLTGKKSSIINKMADSLLPRPKEINMSIGLSELVLILVVVLLLFGGKRIPELAKALGKASYEYKKAKEALENEAASFKETIEKSIEQENDDKKNNK